MSNSWNCDLFIHWLVVTPADGQVNGGIANAQLTNRTSELSRGMNRFQLESIIETPIEWTPIR